VLKAVIDTNQFVCGMINAQGPSAQMLDLWRRQEFILITSDEILREIHKVMHYPKIMRKYGLTEEEIDELLHTVEHYAIVLGHLPKLKFIREDPDDDKFLACAVAAEVDYIVSGDVHLLSLRSFQNIPIVTVREFLKNF
jgi:uncharacterized protein